MSKETMDEQTRNKQGVRSAGHKPKDIILKMENLTKTYVSGEDRLLILDGIDFELSRGEFMSLTGESGSGKSTFLNIAGALDKADSGFLCSCGMDLFKSSVREMAVYRNRHTGFIFQFHYLLKDFTALENVMMPGRILGAKASFLRDRSRELLERVGLGKRSHHYPGQLSGGERQRVALARAMVNAPELILADEPTGSLDEKNSRLVEELLIELSAEQGVSLMLVSHNRALAARASRPYILKGGKLLPS